MLSGLIAFGILVSLALLALKFGAPSWDGNDWQVHRGAGER